MPHCKLGLLRDAGGQRARLVLCALLSAAWPARAGAFSSPTTYDLTTQEAGGGGRWFTGSPADQGGQPAELSVTGLPIDGYVPGMAYAITVTWPPALEDLALVAEFTDEQRKSAGMLALPRVDAYTPPDLCAPDEGGSPATDLYQSSDGRTMIGLVDCGAHVSRFQWTAPAIAAGKVWFNAGFVVSNGDAAPTGDGVTLAARVLAPVGSAAQRMVTASGCNALGTGGVSGAALWLLPLVLFGLGRRGWRV